jgi:hypothetical protein
MRHGRMHQRHARVAASTRDQDLHLVSGTQSRSAAPVPMASGHEDAATKAPAMWHACHASFLLQRDPLAGRDSDPSTATTTAQP